MDALHFLGPASQIDPLSALHFWITYLLTSTRPLIWKTMALSLEQAYTSSLRSLKPLEELLNTHQI